MIVRSAPIAAVATVKVSARDIERLARHLACRPPRSSRSTPPKATTKAPSCAAPMRRAARFSMARPARYTMRVQIPASAFRTRWCAATARSPAACGNSSTAPVTARSSITRSKRLRSKLASGAKPAVNRSAGR